MKPNTILTLSKQLIALKSTPGNREVLEQCLQIVLSHLEGFTVEHFESEGVKSVLIHNQKTQPKKFRIILNGHLDVIPGKDHQYKPRVENNRLYGVGALDMKSNLSCLIAAFSDTAKKVNYPLGLQIVTDEEIGGFNGTKYQITKGVKADFVIAGETTNFNIAHKAKGVIWAKISSTGVSAHGAYPWRGTNAIWRMKHFLDQLEKEFPIPTRQQWITTVNLSNVSSTNQAFNKIPDNCEAWLDIRYIPEDQKKVLPKIKKLLSEGLKIEIVTHEPALFVEKENKYIQVLKKISEQTTGRSVKLYGAQGSSDARHYTKMGYDGIEFGPIGGGIASDQEWIDISSLETYHKILTTFLLSLSNK